MFMTGLFLLNLNDNSNQWKSIIFTDGIDKFLANIIKYFLISTGTMLILILIIPLMPSLSAQSYISMEAPYVVPCFEAGEFAIHVYDPYLK